MQEKTITITLAPEGTSKIDLEGFRDNACTKVADDFRAGDRLLTERKKPSFYNASATPQHQGQQ
jgi:hypothetical protein